MRWPWHRHEGDGRESEKAMERATEATEEVRRLRAEGSANVERARHQRAWNHFGADIADALAQRKGD